MSSTDATPTPPQHRIARRTALAGAAAAALVGVGPLAGSAQAAGFGWSDDGTNYVIDTGANLVFKVNHSTGDLVSLVYRGVEYQGYSGKNSQVESGLGASTVTIATVNSTILVTVVHGTLKHYYAARSGQNTIYMWTYKADSSVNAGRYIVRIKPNIFPNTGPDAWDETTGTVIEAADIWRSTDGTTHSKHYSGLRTMDYDYVGKTTGSVGLWLLRSNHEKASGGPFYRSLLRGSTTAAQDFYEILQYSMAQSDVTRYGLQGPYLLNFTDGGTPSSSLYARNLDTSWVDSLGLTGWVGSSGRGRVVGNGISGMDTSVPYTVGFSNSNAQYWASASSSGAYTCEKMLPGTYTLTVYKGELAVVTTSVTVSAGSTTTVNTLTVSSDPSKASVIWRIGDWNGTPAGFKNADLMTTAHPSDVRAASWTGNYVVGSSSAANFPCYMWKDVNNDLLVYFKLTAAQAAAAHTLRIGLTATYIGGRPQVSVNSWTSSAPSAPTEPSTRSLTVGTYRENNATLTYSVPASAWQTDTSQYNVLKLSIISGSTGTGFLSPGVSFDCLDLLA
ncbi:rhamnogalacturonan lyase B N-terminal domain-containing protein [Streptomyces sp. NPDC004542]|uniref:rhamnogalacturonan lyase B N-terminal domain-containing protein n=1 Tax=Streptomyces sp. NPDC004542 TaxID=3154281 RepID=UPI0033A208C6